MFLTYLLTNLVVVILYASYSVPTSPLHKNLGRSLLGTAVTTLLGGVLVVIHAYKQGKQK
jgi:hypothetical protein